MVVAVGNIRVFINPIQNPFFLNRKYKNGNDRIRETGAAFNGSA